MNKKKEILKNLITRALSGGIYVALIFCAIFFIDITPALFVFVFSLFTALGMWEINKLTSEGDVKAPLISLIDIIGGVAVFISFFLLYTSGDTKTFWMLPMLIYLVIRVIVQLYMPSINAVHSLERSFLSICYVGVPLGLLNSVCAVSHPMMLLSIFIFLWLNDTGAYLVGSMIGKHRLFERISPKKSWEGFWGGLIVCIIGSIIIGLYFNDFFHGPTVVQWVILSIIVSVAGTFGDLAESLIKRTVDVKDSSHIIPGHGGILDRIDSMLLAVPASLIFFIIIKHFL